MNPDLVPALGYYLSTYSTNTEMGINWLGMMLTLVRRDVNNFCLRLTCINKVKFCSSIFQNVF